MNSVNKDLTEMRPQSKVFKHDTGSQIHGLAD